MALVQETGFDAFALNIGKDSYNKLQLAYAYAAAEAKAFKVRKVAEGACHAP